jgi:hypothetical protein
MMADGRCARSRRGQSARSTRFRLVQLNAKRCAEIDYNAAHEIRYRAGRIATEVVSAYVLRLPQGEFRRGARVLVENHTLEACDAGKRLIDMPMGREK